MIFPIADDDRHLKRVEWVTILLIIANIAVYVYQVANPDFTSGFSAIPREIITNTDLVGVQEIQVENQRIQLKQTPGPSPIFLTIFSAMFMHGSLMHLGSNMLFLWIFGDNVENRFGAMRFIIFYVVSGIVASIAHILMAPNSVIPSLGASGAIAGVLGAYLVLFPHNQVRTLVFFFWVVSVPAIIVIGLWGLFQVIPMIQRPVREGGGVAYAAHVGGLVAGIVLGLIFRFTMSKEPDSVLYRTYARDDRSKQIR